MLPPTRSKNLRIGEKPLQSLRKLRRNIPTSSSIGSFHKDIHNIADSRNVDQVCVRACVRASHWEKCPESGIDVDARIFRWYSRQVRQLEGFSRVFEDSLTGVCHRSAIEACDRCLCACGSDRPVRTVGWSARDCSCPSNGRSDIPRAREPPLVDEETTRDTLCSAPVPLLSRPVMRFSTPHSTGRRRRSVPTDLFRPRERRHFPGTPGRCSTSNFNSSTGLATQTLQLWRLPACDTGSEKYYSRFYSVALCNASIDRVRYGLRHLQLEVVWSSGNRGLNLKVFNGRNRILEVGT